MEDKTKSVAISSPLCRVEELQNALSRLAKDSTFTVKICTNELEKASESAYGLLQHHYKMLYDLLQEAQACVKICASYEKKNDPVPYYHSRDSSTCGAKGLLHDIDTAIHNYASTMIEIDLHR